MKLSVGAPQTCLRHLLPAALRQVRLYWGHCPPWIQIPWYVFVQSDLIVCLHCCTPLDKYTQAPKTSPAATFDDKSELEIIKFRLSFCISVIGPAIAADDPRAIMDRHRKILMAASS